ncbi:MAG: hypothetical protein EOP04_19155 [Proteobacteria bacterium]|nr:MAG: hypothetical protein EOP04_19155 [Pseudomonadota bacterium]
MIRGLSCSIAFLFLLGCASKSPAPSEQRVPAQQSQIAVPNSSDITIWTLQQLARDKRYDVLNELFTNHGLAISQLPQGYAAGAAARVLDMPGPLADSRLEILTSKSWRGKIFFPSTNPRKSRGLNRIRQGVIKTAGIVPMASFTTEVLDSDPLTPGAHHLVNLNYANPVTQGKYWQEKVLKLNTQVYDLMVPVQGKYGVVYIGKTWLGNYDKQGVFTARYPDNLIAWFFLDFNPQALDIQQAQYWDGSKETKLDPLPQVVD